MPSTMPMVTRIAGAMGMVLITASLSCSCRARGGGAAGPWDGHDRRSLVLPGEDVAQLPLPDGHDGARLEGLPQQAVGSSRVVLGHIVAVAVMAPGGGGVAVGNGLDLTGLCARGQVAEKVLGQLPQGAVACAVRFLAPPWDAALGELQAEGILDGLAAAAEKLFQRVSQPLRQVLVQGLAGQALEWTPPRWSCRGANRPSPRSLNISLEPVVTSGVTVKAIRPPGRGTDKGSRRAALEAVAW